MTFLHMYEIIFVQMYFGFYESLSDKIALLS